MTQFVTQTVAIFELAWQRMIALWGQYLALTLGSVVALTTVCTLILYSEATNSHILQTELAEAHQNANFDVLVRGADQHLDGGSYQALDILIRQHLQQQIGLPLTSLTRHGWSKSLSLRQINDQSASLADEPARVRLQFYSDLESQTNLLAGQYASPITDSQTPIEVLATPALAEKLGLQVGDSLRLEAFTGATTPLHLSGKLTGLIQPAETSRLYAPRFLDEALTVPEATFLQVVVLTIVPNDVELTWAANFDQQAINLSRVGRVLGGLDQLRFQLAASFDETQVLTRLDSILRTYRSNIFQLRGLLLIIGLPIVALALYFMVLTAHILVENQRGEIAWLQSRGSSSRQILALLLLQGGITVSVGILMAPWLALPATWLLGQASNFLVFDAARPLPVTFQPQLYGYALPMGLVSFIALAWPTWQAAQQTMVTYRQQVARPQSRALVHRWYLDLVLLALGTGGYLILSRQGSIIGQNEAGRLTLDPLLLLTPIALVIGLTLLALRFLPHFLNTLTALTSHTNSVAALFAIQQLARTPARYQGLLLLLTFTLVLGLFTATVAHTINSNASDQAQYAVGADLRTREFDHHPGQWVVRPVSYYQAIPGVEAVSPAKRVRLVGRRAEIRATGTLLALDLETIAAVAWWRPDFWPPLDQLRLRLSQYDNAILADETFIEIHHLQPGDTFEIDVDGQPIPFTLVGLVGYFPTIYHPDGSQLVTRLDYLTQATATAPSEVWLRVAPNQQAAVSDALQSQADALIFTGSEQVTISSPDDPLQVGLFGFLSLSFIAASALCVLGFLLYAYTNIQNRAVHFGILRASGLSMGQLSAILGVEQFLLVGLSLLLGTLLGSGAGWLFTRFLQLSIVAREAVPPFLITPPWPLVGRLYLNLLIIFSLALGLSIYLLRSLRIHMLLRLGEA